MSYDAVDHMFKRPFKFKYRGMKLTARPMSDDEIITKKSLMAMPSREFKSQFDINAEWMPSKSVGEKVADHPVRWYIEVLSPFYQGESTDEYTGL